jgi:hypothetical protein
MGLFHDELNAHVFLSQATGLDAIVLPFVFDKRAAWVPGKDGFRSVQSLFIAEPSTDTHFARQFQ